mgnify:CR=1 FL=1
MATALSVCDDSSNSVLTRQALIAVQSIASVASEMASGTLPVGVEVQPGIALTV